MTTNKVHDPECEVRCGLFKGECVRLHGGNHDCTCPAPTEDENGHAIDSTGALIYDKRCNDGKCHVWLSAPTSKEKDNRPEAVLDRVLIRAGKIPPTKEAPTSVTGEEWEEELRNDWEEYTKKTRQTRGITSEMTSDWWIERLLAQRTHIKQALLGRVDGKSFHADCPHFDERLLTLDDIISIINEELA